MQKINVTIIGALGRMGKILIRVEDEMARIERIKEVDKPMFAEVEYIE